MRTEPAQTDDRFGQITEQNMSAANRRCAV
jgi:hypothetical protein